MYIYVHLNTYMYLGTRKEWVKRAQLAQADWTQRPIYNINPRGAIAPPPKWWR
jgi:hypothetical protein